jgi:hypothetical protein
MTPDSILRPTFQEAMEISAHWLVLWDNGELSDEVLGDRVAEIVASTEGARGFFVVSLAGDCPLMDRLPEPVAFALRQGGVGVIDLIVRNLAMSTAMVVHHKRQADTLQQSGSERVQARCTELLQMMAPDLVKLRLEQLLEGTKGRGQDVSFLKRWGYDADQINQIADAALSVAD